jgi:hypothetical protein
MPTGELLRAVAQVAWTWAMIWLPLLVWLAVEALASLQVRRALARRPLYPARDPFEPQGVWRG